MQPCGVVARIPSVRTVEPRVSIGRVARSVLAVGCLLAGGVGPGMARPVRTGVVLPPVPPSGHAAERPRHVGRPVAAALPRPRDKVTVPGVFSPIWRGAYHARPGQVPWLRSPDGLEHGQGPSQT